MKPPLFLYLRPDSLEEALAAMHEHGDEARPLAGGQSLVPMLNFRLARPEVLVDLSRVEELVGTSCPGPSAISFGAMTPQRAAERLEKVRSTCPLVSMMLPFVGHVQNRARGTIGGSIAHADPAAELPALCLALGGTVVARNAEGERRLRADGFFGGPFTTALMPDELLTSVELPGVRREDVAFAEIARRQGDFAMAGVVAVRETAQTAVRLVAFGVGGTPVRLPRAEKILEGQELTPACIAEAASAAAGEVDPIEDLHADGRTRRALVDALVRRVLGELGSEGAR